MAAIRLLELLILLAMLSGFLGLLLHRNLFLKVLSMDVLGSAVVALFVLVAARTGLRSPILSTLTPAPPCRRSFSTAPPMPSRRR